jgi:competence protein ComEC
VLISASAYPQRRAGDLVEVAGRLARPPARPDFSYADYLARRGVGWAFDFPETRPVGREEPPLPLSALAAVRERLMGALAAALPEPQASLAVGLLVGTGSGFPADLLDEMAKTGTLHLVAVSGYNITVVAGALMLVIVPLAGRRRAAYFVLPAIAAYVLLVGPSASVVRAAIMGALFALAYHFGRQSAAGYALALAVAAMLAVNPLWIAEAGFQLSALATGGLILAAPLAARLTYDRWLRWPALRGPAEALAGGLIAGVAPALVTAPVAAAAFGRLSLIGPVVSLLVEPAIPPAMLVSFLAGTAGALWAPLGTALGWLAWLPLSAILAAIRLGATLPSAYLDGLSLPAWSPLAVYALAGLALVLARRRPRLPVLPALRAGNYAAPALLGALAVSGWTLALTEEPPRSALGIVAAGPDVVVLASDGAGHRALLGGAASPDALTAATGEALPFWDRALDLVAPLGDERAQLVGLVPLIERQPVALALAPATPADATSRRYLEALDARRIRRESVFQETSVALGDRLVLRFQPLPAAGKAPTARLAEIRTEGGAALFVPTLSAEQARLVRRKPVDLLIAAGAPPEALAVLFAATHPRAIVLAGVESPPTTAAPGREVYALRDYRRLDFAAVDGRLVLVGSSGR